MAGAEAPELSARVTGRSLNIGLYATDTWRIAPGTHVTATARFNRAITDNLPGRVSYWDRELRCRYANRAYLDWIELSGRKTGPVFPSIDRWGNVSNEHMLSKTVLPLLRRILHAAGAEEAASYSSHSLRRGFANWASSNGWDLKELMEHVGWRDVSSALRYIDISLDGMKTKFESGLARSAPSSS